MSAFTATVVKQLPNGQFKQYVNRAVQLPEAYTARVLRNNDKGGRLVSLTVSDNETKAVVNHVTR